MRINIYSQEIDLGTNAQIVTKVGTNEEGGPEVFYGVRFYLHSPSQLHDTDKDDDRSAVTFWVPRSGRNRRDMADQFSEAAALITSVIIPGE
jgi:hypothetical protein